MLPCQSGARGDRPPVFSSNPAHRKAGRQFYRVTLNGKVIVAQSWSPEFAACRTMQKGGRCGRVEFYWAGVPYPGLIIRDLAEGARLCVIEENLRGHPQEMATTEDASLRRTTTPRRREPPRSAVLTARQGSGRGEVARPFASGICARGETTYRKHSLTQTLPRRPLPR